jgi:hypothetical protein
MMDILEYYKENIIKKDVESAIGEVEKLNRKVETIKEYEKQIEKGLYISSYILGGFLIERVFGIKTVDGSLKSTILVGNNLKYELFPNPVDSLSHDTQLLTKEDAIELLNKKKEEYKNTIVKIESDSL